MIFEDEQLLNAAVVCILWHNDSTFVTGLQGEVAFDKFRGCCVIYRSN